MKITKNLKWLSLSIILGVVLGGGLIIAKAWTDPSVAPPGGNLGAPINTSSNSQVKTGPLQVNVFRNVGTSILDGNVGIGTASPTQRLDVSGAIRSTGQHLINNTSPTIYFQDSDHRSAMLHTNSNQFYLLRGSGNNATAWQSTGGYWPLVINLENNDATLGRNLNVNDVYIRAAGKWASTLGGASGSGTTNYITKWTGVNSIGNSQIFDNGSNVGIGWNNPTQKLDVNGNINVRGSQIRMANSSSHFYGDSINLASRSQSGNFYIQNSSGVAGTLNAGGANIGSGGIVAGRMYSDRRRQRIRSQRTEI